MEAIMQWLMKCCARGALGLGAAALLLAGVPAHAGPASGAASREGQPLRLAQSTAQPEEAEQLEKRRLQEQQEREKRQQQKMQSDEKPETQQPRKMRSLEKQAPAAAPTKPGGSRFGAGVIRHSDPGEAGVE
jgi:hypothetical protein